MTQLKKIRYPLQHQTTKIHNIPLDMKIIGIHKTYELAQERYAEYGVDTESVLEQMEDFHLSFNTWQLEDPRTDAVCRGRSAEELRQDFVWAKTMVPGRHRLNINIMSPAEKGCEAIRNAEINLWKDWSRSQRVELDLQVNVQDKLENYTLTSIDPATRQHWIDYVTNCREIANTLGENQKSICLLNLAIMDQLTEPTLQRMLYRQLLEESLDQALSKSMTWMRDSLESFDSLTGTPLVASQELLSNYAVRRRKMVTLTTGLLLPSPSSTIDNISSLMLSVPGLLIHLRRPSRWVSVEHSLMDDNGMDTFLEIVNSGIRQRVHYSMDYYTPHIPRAQAYAIGARSAQCCMIRALLQPIQKIHYYELNGNQYQKAALVEEAKTLPWGAVYNEYCLRNDVPISIEQIDPEK